MLIQSICKEYRDQLFLSGMTMKVFSGAATLRMRRIIAISR